MQPSSVRLFLGALTVAALASAQTKCVVPIPTPCNLLTPPTVENATVTNFTTSTVTPATGAAYCDAEVYLTHGNDSVRIEIAMPLTGWNYRFQGLGGGGFTAGSFGPSAVAPAVNAGYAAGSTDAGLTATLNLLVPWFGNNQLFVNFAYLSVHEMTVVGKQMVRQFYGRPHKYAYWNGCSTGGRQGHQAAQRYPTDYNGVYGASPAINYGRFQIAMLWQYVVSHTEGELVQQCVYTTLTNAAIQACDLVDGGADNMIGNPALCYFDANDYVGMATGCSPSTNVTAREADIFNKIMQGPVDLQGNRLWYGIVPGAPYSGIVTNPPFPNALGWAVFAYNNLSYSPNDITYESFPDLFDLVYTTYDSIIGSDNPDLTPFKEAGGKLLSWHGWSDQLIFPNGTIDYRLRVEALMGGTTAVDDFYRLFMVPGVQHCGGGNGAVPNDPFDVLVSWVENGTAPTTLAGTGTGGITRNHCLWPEELYYSGSGNISLASSWGCKLQSYIGLPSGPEGCSSTS